MPDVFVMMNRAFLGFIEHHILLILVLKSIISGLNRGEVLRGFGRLLLIVLLKGLHPRNI